MIAAQIASALPRLTSWCRRHYILGFVIQFVICYMIFCCCYFSCLVFPLGTWISMQIFTNTRHALLTLKFILNLSFFNACVYLQEFFFLYSRFSCMSEHTRRCIYVCSMCVRVNLKFQLQWTSNSVTNKPHSYR